MTNRFRDAANGSGTEVQLIDDEVDDDRERNIDHAATAAVAHADAKRLVRKIQKPLIAWLESWAMDYAEEKA